MSLINDALKRASKTMNTNPPQDPEGAPLQPAEHPKRAPGSLSRLLIVIVCIIGCAGVAFGLFKLWQGSKTSAGASETNAPPDQRMTNAAALAKAAPASARPRRPPQHSVLRRRQEKPKKETAKADATKAPEPKPGAAAKPAPEAAAAKPAAARQHRPPPPSPKPKLQPSQA